MNMRYITFSETAQFTGFNAKQSLSAIYPITQLGSVTFKCQSESISAPIVVEEVTETDSFPLAEEKEEEEADEEDRTWKDSITSFYEEYDIIIFLIAGLILAIFLSFVFCFCVGRCKKREIDRLKKASEQRIEAYNKRIRYLEDRQVKDENLFEISKKEGFSSIK